MQPQENPPGHELSPLVEGGRPQSTQPLSLEQSIAESTRQMRQARGLTLAELAAKVGISRQMLSKIENAQTSASLATVSALAQGLEVPVTSLFRAADFETEAVFVKAGTAPQTVRRGSNLGPSASLPVMEGKSALFKRFAGLNSIPIVLDTNDTDEIVETIVRIAPSFGAVNLEDISAPRCFEIERRLIEALDKPVMHDDQHGTAVVVLAALINAATVTGKELADLRVVISGAGAAGIAVADILLASGVTDLIVLDSRGALHNEREDITGIKREMARKSNPRGKSGGTERTLAGADVFIGVSSSQVPEAHIAQMADNAIVFALSNPDPEIHPEIALKHAAVVATGRSDFPNQINNVLAFPGIFRGALDAGARRITTEMKLAAARAIAGLVEEPTAELIVPNPFAPGVADSVARAVMQATRPE